jgi:single-strand DNA-binding protein
MLSATFFAENPTNNVASVPDICTGPCSLTPLRRTALKRVKVTTSGAEQQVPAKHQNRGPGNSTGEGFKTLKSEKGKHS